MTASWTGELDEPGVGRLAELLALKIATGDAIALSGALGTGKTTFARALIGALLREATAEVPSPTFSLAQTYAAPRLTVTHFDFYRLNSPEEARELGFDEATDAGAVIVEWPERAPSLLPAARYDIEFAETADPAVRRVTMRGRGDNAARNVRRIGELMGFLARQTGWGTALISYLQGDASTRSYARLSTSAGSAILMDAPRQPDGPPIRDGKPYSRIALLAEDMVRPFVAVGSVLRGAGLSAPEVLAADLDKGILLVEDLGDRLFGAEMRSGTSQAELWRTAVDALIVLRGVPVPNSLPLTTGTSYALPRRDRAAFEIEIELLLDWLWPALKGAPAPASIRTEFSALWTPVIDRLLALPGGWFLRDYHSPNLIWLPGREGVARVGILDFQDALHESFAFDLVSLLQDARVDVPADLESDLFAHYCRQVKMREPAFDSAGFAAAYADFGAQRNTRLLGLWARLLKRDGKPQYLQHFPRTWGYLVRNLRNPSLAPLAAWYERHFPPELRSARLLPA
jgi:tRNA threonylcarbamoyl adenosine modification protein YjeE